MTAAWLVALLFVPGMAAVQELPPCGARSVIETMLQNDYGERPVGSRVADNGMYLVIWRNAETGTWTLVSILPVNTTIACMISAGKHWLEGPDVPVTELGIEADRHND